MNLFYEFKFTQQEYEDIYVAKKIKAHAQIPFTPRDQRDRVEVLLALGALLTVTFEYKATEYWQIKMMELLTQTRRTIFGAGCVISNESIYFEDVGDSSVRVFFKIYYGVA